VVGSTQLWQPPRHIRANSRSGVSNEHWIFERQLLASQDHTQAQGGRERGKVEDGSRRGKIKMQGKFIPVLVGLALTSSSYVLSIVSVYHENKGWCA